MSESLKTSLSRLVIITSTTENKVKRNLHLVIKRLLRIRGRRKLHTDQESGQKRFSIIRLVASFIIKPSSRTVNSSLRQISSIYGRSNSVFSKRGSRLLIRRAVRTNFIEIGDINTINTISIPSSNLCHTL